jgi:hypothetical protein
MKKYSEFSPTKYDRHINFEESREDWLVLDVTQTRDSEVLSQSNFKAAVKILGGEQEDLVEVHRFGHWGPGWFELILLHPSLEKEGKEIEAALANHPVLDEELLSEMEEEEYQQSWNSWAYRDFVRVLVGAFGLCDSTEDWLLDHKDELYSFHREHAPESNLNFQYVTHRNHPTRDDLVKFIRETRKVSR